MAKKVVILGGGVAGMSAAHELVERGFAVEIFERLRLPGGKARSVPVYPDVHGEPSVFDVSLERWFQAERARKLQARRDWLPGEHGFRFFPGFYRHVVDTMQRIPYGTRTVADNLVPTSTLLLARFDRDGLVVPSRFPHNSHDFANVLDLFFKSVSGHLGVGFDDIAFFAGKIWQIMTSCHERREHEYEKIGWWEFVGAAERSTAYQNLFAHGMTRALVASKAELASTFTIGNTFVQLLLNVIDPSVPTSDRLLNGPTNLVWIEPWLNYLQSRGVTYNFNTPVKAITAASGRIESVTVLREGQERTVKGDYYVAALPIEQIVPLITRALTIGEPRLANLPTLAKNVEWMGGIQFFLKRRAPIAHGHINYIDSPWALTSVSQNQFWADFEVSEFGDGDARDILSVVISDWNKKGLNGKTVKECTRDEAARETWAQMKRSLNVGGREVLKDEDWDNWFMDPDVFQSTQDRRIVINTEPLLVNLKDTLRLRPDAVTSISNFFLASDYVRTHTDLATMEAANEAARRAVNGILEASGSSAARCAVWPLYEPDAFEPLRTYDREVRWSQGLPHDPRFISGPLWAVELVRNFSALLPKGPGPFHPVEPVGSAIKASSTHAALPFDVGTGIELAKQVLPIVGVPPAGATPGQIDEEPRRTVSAAPSRASSATQQASQPSRQRRLRIVQNPR